MIMPMPMMPVQVQMTASLSLAAQMCPTNDDDELDLASLVDVDAEDGALASLVPASCMFGVAAPSAVSCSRRSSHMTSSSVGGADEWVSLGLSKQTSFPDMALLYSRFNADDGDADALELAGT